MVVKNTHQHNIPFSLFKEPYYVYLILWSQKKNSELRGFCFSQFKGLPRHLWCDLWFSFHFSNMLTSSYPRTTTLGISFPRNAPSVNAIFLLVIQYFKIHWLREKSLPPKLKSITSHSLLSHSGQFSQIIYNFLKLFLIIYFYFHLS